ncbi:MAG: hypothetical protein IJ192_03700 [Clostridia bacterium]|nr:hypothetical protein [Clostridia bacterium]
MSEQDKINLFLTMVSEYMLRRSDEFERDRINVFNNVSLHRLSSDDYYSMLVTEIQEATAKAIFREIRSIIDVYLRQND